MSKPAIQSQDYKFNVVQQPIIHNGRKTGFFGNFREDTGVCLGITSDQYGLVQNDELMESAYAALSSRGLSGYKERIIVTVGGKRLYAEFTFQEKQLAMAVGDIFGYKLILKNSFDRSLRLAFALGFQRLTCLNGASTMEKEFAATQKHSSKVSVEFLGAAIDKALTHGKSALAVYDQMAQKAITDEQGQLILKNLVAQKVLSGSLSQSMETLWLAPRRDEDKARNVYNLYNAVTEHLTHQVSTDRFEYAEKVSSQVLLRLVNAARNQAQLEKLLTPIPKAIDVASVVVV
jgi:hypothetical protein